MPRLCWRAPIGRFTAPRTRDATAWKLTTAEINQTFIREKDNHGHVLDNRHCCQCTAPRPWHLLGREAVEAERPAPAAEGMNQGIRVRGRRGVITRAGHACRRCSSALEQLRDSAVDGAACPIKGSARDNNKESFRNRPPVAK